MYIVELAIGMVKSDVFLVVDMAFSLTEDSAPSIDPYMIMGFYQDPG